MTVNERRARERERRHRLIVDKARALAETEGWDAVTTRRLSALIEYSQPVLYSHFRNKDAIVAAVALEGFAELTEALRRARSTSELARGALTAAVQAYLDFAEANPAVYEAMFTRTVPLRFAHEDTPEALRAGFAEIEAVVTPYAFAHHAATLAEVTWAAVHGLATLSRDHRLRPEEHRRRVEVLVDRVTGRGPDTARR